MPKISFVCKENGRPYEPTQIELDCFLSREPVYKIVIGRNDKWYSSFISVDTQLKVRGLLERRILRNLLHEYKVGYATRCKTDEGIYCFSILPTRITREAYEYHTQIFKRKQGLCAILKCFPEERKERAFEFPHIYRTQSIYVDSIVWQGHEINY